MRRDQKHRTIGVNKLLKRMTQLSALCFLLSGVMTIPFSCTGGEKGGTMKKEVKRVGMVIKLRPECMEEYKAIHSDSVAGVRDLLAEANMRNFSIFLHQLDDGNWYEFGYYEYTGNDFEGDMAKLAKNPRNIEWLKVCDPMQVPLDGYEGWAEMEQVYYNE